MLTQGSTGRATDRPEIQRLAVQLVDCLKSLPAEEPDRSLALNYFVNEVGDAIFDAADDKLRRATCRKKAPLFADLDDGGHDGR